MRLTLGIIPSVSGRVGALKSSIRQTSVRLKVLIILKARPISRCLKLDSHA